MLKTLQASTVSRWMSLTLWKEVVGVGKWSSFSPAWAMLLDWEMSGGSHIFASSMVEGPSSFLISSCWWSLAYQRSWWSCILASTQQWARLLYIPAYLLCSKDLALQTSSHNASLVSITTSSLPGPSTTCLPPSLQTSPGNIATMITMTNVSEVESLFNYSSFASCRLLFIFRVQRMWSIEK